MHQSLKSRLLPQLTNIINNTPTDSLLTQFSVKLTGDGTQIGRGITVVNIGLHCFGRKKYVEPVHHQETQFSHSQSTRI